MAKIVKQLGLIMTLLAWVVFPLPECYVTSPHCPLRNHPSACHFFNHQQNPVQESAAHTCCNHASSQAGQMGAAGRYASHHEKGRMAAAVLSPKFLLSASPDLPGPAIGFKLPAPVSLEPTPAAACYTPYLGERVDPVPIRLRTHAFLI